VRGLFTENESARQRRRRLIRYERVNPGEEQPPAGDDPRGSIRAAGAMKLSMTALGAFCHWGFLGKNAQNLARGVHQTKSVRFLAGMTSRYIMRPQLSGCDRLGGASQDRGFRLDHNASLKPNDCEQFDLLSAKSAGREP
jgi:hypothetical protein